MSEKCGYCYDPDEDGSGLVRAWLRVCGGPKGGCRCDCHTEKKSLSGSPVSPEVSSASSSQCTRDRNAPPEPTLSKRMQKFRDERGESACPWPGYWIAEVGEMEAYIADLRAELLKQVINTAQNMGRKLEAAREELSETSVPEGGGRHVVNPDDPLWEACQKFVMSLAEDPALGQPEELHFWGLLKVRVYDFVCKRLAEARKQGGLELEMALERRMCEACRDGNEPRRVDNAWLHDRLDWNGNPGPPFLCGATTLRDHIAKLEAEERT